VAVGAGVRAFAGKGLAQDNPPEHAPGCYPPALTGMQGSHPGSFEAAHELRDDRKVDLSGVSHTNKNFDLAIVGGHERA
jgi:spermidine dehydrogenase